MAEDLDDGEFWLPPHFLTDDDILMDFDFSPPTKPGQSLSGFTSNSDLDFTSGCTETESDEEEILLTGGLNRQMGRVTLEETTCPVHSKGSVLSSSPQSTLCGCLCNQGSSRDSPSGPVSPPQPPPKANEKDNNATLDLLNKAAGEVARLKMKSDDSNNNNNNNNKKSTGTGFFDCSQKGILYPAPLRNPDHFPPLYFQPQFHHFPPMVWSPSVGAQYNQPKKQPPPQNRATKNSTTTTSKSSNNNRPLGLPPSAWPPLQAQNQAHNMQPAPVFPGPKRECAGTGVFLPRRVTTPPETRKKSEGNTNNTKTKSGKGSQSQSNNRRNSRATTTASASSANPNDIQLPQEWTY